MAVHHGRNASHVERRRLACSTRGGIAAEGFGSSKRTCSFVVGPLFRAGRDKLAPRSARAKTISAGGKASQWP